MLLQVAIFLSYNVLHVVQKDHFWPTLLNSRPRSHCCRHECQRSRRGAFSAQTVWVWSKFKRSETVSHDVRRCEMHCCKLSMTPTWAVRLEGKISVNDAAAVSRRLSHQAQKETVVWEAQRFQASIQRSNILKWETLTDRLVMNN